jgi:hypothetical protein
MDLKLTVKEKSVDLLDQSGEDGFLINMMLDRGWRDDPELMDMRDMICVCSNGTEVLLQLYDNMDHRNVSTSMLLDPEEATALGKILIKAGRRK